MRFIRPYSADRFSWYYFVFIWFSDIFLGVLSFRSLSDAARPSSSSSPIVLVLVRRPRYHPTSVTVRALQKSLMIQVHLISLWLLS